MITCLASTCTPASAGYETTPDAAVATTRAMATERGSDNSFINADVVHVPGGNDSDAEAQAACAACAVFTAAASTATDTHSSAHGGTHHDAVDRLARRGCSCQREELQTVRASGVTRPADLWRRNGRPVQVPALPNTLGRKSLLYTPLQTAETSARGGGVAQASHLCCQA